MSSQPRARELGIAPGRFRPGRRNAITDVRGVRVGHATVRREPDVHTGVTVLLPGDVNPNAPLPAGFFSGNGFGKIIGTTQLTELGELESPIALTSTLSSFRVADALVSWMLARPDCVDVTSFNPVVAECNDGFLSDGRARAVGDDEVRAAFAAATDGPVAEGSVGAGTGMTALGFKSGIGTSSRQLTVRAREVRVGTLVLANFGGTLRTGGRVVPGPDASTDEDGSCVVVVATDAAVNARQLTRLARRAVYGLARVGASYSHGSGDYGLAVSTLATPDSLPDKQLSPLFEAVLDCVEESVLNGLLAADTTVGFGGRTAVGLRPEQLSPGE